MAGFEVFCLLAGLLGQSVGQNNTPRGEGWVNNMARTWETEDQPSINETGEYKDLAEAVVLQSNTGKAVKYTMPADRKDKKSSPTESSISRSKSLSDRLRR